MPQIAAWDSFYVIVGSAAGALIGLQFVVMALIAERPPPGASEAAPAFATPTVVHFSTVLLLAAALRAPWPAGIAVALVWGAVGVAGCAYTAVVAWRMRTQSAYAPQFEDWLCHALLPGASYVLLALSALLAGAYPLGSAFGAGGAVLLLLFTAVHNVWDAVTYHVLVYGPKSRD